MSDIDTPGADVVLAAIRVLAPVQDRKDELSVQYRTSRWSDEKNGFEESEPHYVAYLDCSDTFFWGSADAEEVTAENLHILEGVIADLLPLYNDAWERLRGPEGTAQKERRTAAYEAYKEAHGGDHTGWSSSPEHRELYDSEIHVHKFLPIGDLFAARVRKMRPQGAAYKVRYDESIWHLFNECGPKRETGFGNPKEPGQ